MSAVARSTCDSNRNEIFDRKFGKKNFVHSKNGKKEKTKK